MRSKLPLLPSGPGGVRKSAFHGPWQNYWHNLDREVWRQQELSRRKSACVSRPILIPMRHSTTGCFPFSIHLLATQPSMEVKVQCPCGTRYKFDVEPINAHMPGPVSCPTCGADGTTASEAIIQQSLNARVVTVGAGGGHTVEKPRIRLHVASPNTSGSAQAVAPMAPIAGHESTAPLQTGGAAALAASPPRESQAPRPVPA